MLLSGYLHFDDPRLRDFKVKDFYKIEDLWKDKDVYQFDELQNVPEWETYIRHLVERSMSVGITGSNSKMLSSELGTLLTGRYVSYELFPFSYSEFIDYKNVKPDYSSFLEYFKIGGFPEAVRYNLVGYHNELFNNIIQRDISLRYGIRHVNTFNKIALHLVNNCSRLFSYSKLAKSYQIPSVKTVSDYVSMLEEGYLIFTVPIFSYSYRKQINNPKKVYIVDHAFARENSTKLFDDYGRLLENMVFIHLRHSTKEIYYFRNKYECDFVTNENKALKLFQVCWDLNNDNKNREINGLKEAMSDLGIVEGTFITAQQEDTIITDEGNINIIPFWKWATNR